MNLPISSQCLLWPITNYSTILKSRWLNTTNYKQNGGQLLGPLCTHYKKSMILELRTPTHPVQDIWPSCHASLSMNHLQAVTFFPTGKAAMGCCEWLGSWCERSSSPEGCGISVLHHCSLIQNCSCWTDISVPPHPNTLHLSTMFSPDTMDGRKLWPLPKDVPSSKAIFFWAWRAGCCAARLLLLLALHLPASPHEDLGSFGSKHVTPLCSAKGRLEQLQQPQRARFAMLFWLVCYRNTLMLLYHVMLKWCWCAVHDAAKASWHESLTSDVRLHHWFFPAFWPWNSWSSMSIFSIGATPWTHFKYLKQLWHGHGANSPCKFDIGSTMQALALTWRIVETSTITLLQFFPVKRCCFCVWS